MSSVRFSFDRWNRDGTFVKMSDTLRQLTRQALDRDPAPAEWLLDAHHDCFPRLKDMRVDEDDPYSLDTWLQQHTTMRVNVIEQPVGQKGCAAILKRWVVERSIAWAGRNRLVRKEGYCHPESSEAFLYPGSIAMLLDRLYPRS
jgi:putative transposase